MFSDLLYEQVPLMGHYIDFPHLGLGRLRAGRLAFPTRWIRGCLPAASHDIRMVSSLVTVTVRRWLSAHPPALRAGIFAFCKMGDPDPKSVLTGLVTLSVQQGRAQPSKGNLLYISLFVNN